MSVYLCGIAIDFDDQPDVACEPGGNDDDHVVIRILSTTGQELAIRADAELLVRLGQDIFTSAMWEQQRARARKLEAEVAFTSDAE